MQWPYTDSIEAMWCPQSAQHTGACFPLLFMITSHVVPGAGSTSISEIRMRCSGSWLRSTVRPQKRHSNLRVAVWKLLPPQLLQTLLAVMQTACEPSCASSVLQQHRSANACIAPRCGSHTSLLDGGLELLHRHVSQAEAELNKAQLALHLQADQAAAARAASDAAHDCHSDQILR